MQNESGHVEWLDEITKSAESVVSEILAFGDKGKKELAALLSRNNENWVRYLAAAALIRLDTALAKPVLEELIELGGMISINATVTLGMYLQQH